MNYYNEWDKHAAQWIRELIADGLIPPGDVDERSITDVRPEDLKGYVQCHFFAGFAGWSRALRVAGIPDDYQLWSGSCPCQPFSCAGEQAGVNDERHLWPELFRLAAACKPPVVLGEQVASKLGREWLSGVHAQMETLAYDFGSSDLCSPGVKAPNLRQRLYWVAYAKHAKRRTQHVNGENGCDRQDCGREEAHGEFGACSQVQRLADSELPHRRPKHQVNSDTHGRDGSRWRSDNGGLGNADSQGLQERVCDGGIQPEAVDASAWQAVERGGNSGFWNNSVWIPCRDGKFRRVPAQPIFFELAPGLSASVDQMRAEDGFPLCRKGEVPGRTSLLKGIGNSINAELAAVFIKCAFDAINDFTATNTPQNT